LSTWKRAASRKRCQPFRRERVVLWHQWITPKVPSTSIPTGKAIICSPILHLKRASIMITTRRHAFLREKMEKK
jgi:hypothetical protein